MEKTILIKEDNNERFIDFDAKMNCEKQIYFNPISEAWERHYTNPEFAVKLVRTKKTEEDLPVVEMSYTSNEDGHRIRQTLWPRNNAMVDDLKALWPSYDEKMTREALNALPSVPAENAEVRLGIYTETDEEGKPVVDKDGNPVQRSSVKWLFVTIGGQKVELSGDRREYTQA